MVGPDWTTAYILCHDVKKLYGCQFIRLLVIINLFDLLVDSNINTAAPASSILTPVQVFVFLGQLMMTKTEMN